MTAPTCERGLSVNWGKVIDHTRCIGCHACTTACKSENEVPLSVTRTYVKYVDVGTFPDTRRVFQVTRCNQCTDAPCVTACPTAAMYKREDGIVDFDKEICIGCRACMAACPYDAIFINPEDRSAEKCNFCAHRLDTGLEPACVVVCPTQAILVGDLNDETSRVSRIVQRDAVTVRKPEKGTRPNLFYKGGHQATLDPLAAERPPKDMLMWASQPTGDQFAPAGNPAGQNSSAAAMLAYDIPHRIPWDWKVSLYTWTKGIASGAYLVAAYLFLRGTIPVDGAVMQWLAPGVAAIFLVLTAGLLIADLEHPERFFYILTRPQWSSWLVRGGVILTLYALVLAVHLVSSITGNSDLQEDMLFAGVAVAGMTAVYTAYLFAQAKARDMWQSPLLAPHFLVQAVVLGAAAVVPLVRLYDPIAIHPLLDIMAVASVVHVAFVIAEISTTHATANARAAVYEMIRGRFRGFFWLGLALSAVGALAPWLGMVASPVVLFGILLHEHAHVQSAQVVPLA